MKYLVAFTLALLFYIHANSQSIDLADLYTLVRYNNDQFKNEVYKKGFSYSGQLNKINKKGEVYLFERYYDGYQHKTYISKLSRVGPSDVNSVEVQTNNSEIYQNIQAQMITFPFEYLKTDNDNGIVTTYYRFIEKNGQSGLILFFMFDPANKGIFTINLSASSM